MKENYEQRAGERRSTEWDSLGREVEFHDDEEVPAAREPELDTDRNAKYTEYLKGQLDQIYNSSEDASFRRAEEIADIKQQIKAMDPVEKQRAREEAAAAQEAADAERAEVHAEAQEIERFQSQETARENVEKYGSNIGPAAARAGFNQEYFHVKHKIEKVRRAEKREAEMSADERARAEKKRIKAGLVLEPEEIRQYNELKQIAELGGDEKREEYGRRKEKLFRQIQEAKRADWWGFRKVVKREKLDLPKKWDDPEYSVDDLRSIYHKVSHLLAEE